MATAARPATVSGPTTATRSAAASTVVGTITSVGIPDRASKGGRSTMDRFTGATVGHAGRAAEGHGSGPEASQLLPSVTRRRSLRGQASEGYRVVSRTTTLNDSGARKATSATNVRR